MQLNHESFEDLIGAYALDACDEEEVAAVEAYVAGNPDACIEVERLRAAAAWIGAAGTATPPPDLRASLLARAATTVVAADGVDAYTELTDTFADDLEALAPDAVEVVTHNGLTIRELVAHLAAIDEVFVEELTAAAPARPFIDATSVIDITREALDRAGNKPFAELFREWRATRGKLRDAAAASPDRHVMGYSVSDALVIRAFETWTHLDDVRRTTARETYVPRPAVVRSMADLSMRVVPYALAVNGMARPGESMKFVLTGPGGGSWDVPLAPGEHPADDPATVVTVDVIDWCNRFADRLEPDALSMHVEGDRAAATDVVLAAPAFTGL